MKICYFPVYFLLFCDACFYATIQKFRLLDYVFTLYALVLGMTLKRLVFVFNKVHFIMSKKFIQVIFISGRWLKKLNLLIDF